MLEKDKDWENYLLSIGVTNLNDYKEIDEKLDLVERDDPQYQALVKEAIDEVIFNKEPIKSISKEEIIDWLLSLGD